MQTISVKRTLNPADIDSTGNNTSWILTYHNNPLGSIACDIIPRGDFISHLSVDSPGIILSGDFARRGIIPKEI